MSLLLCAWLASSAAAPVVPAGPAARTQGTTLTGRVRIRGERVAIADVHILLVPGTLTPGKTPAWLRRTTTSADGRFMLAGLPAGPVTLVVLVAGFERQQIELDVEAGRAVDVPVYLVRDDTAPFRTVVAPSPDVQTSGTPRIVLSREEVRTLPGTQGDPLRGLTSLPGAARPPFGLGLLVLRGAAPWQSMAMVGEHPVPRAFHSTPTAAILPSEAIESVEYVPGNASARYGPLAGGLVVVQPRVPRRDAIHGHANLDIMGANASLEGPVGRSGFFVAARRGWIDAVLSGYERIDESATFLLPSLWDYQSWLVRRVGSLQLEARVLGAGDRVRSRGRDANFERVAFFDYHSQFHRADLVARYAGARTSVLISPTLRLQSDRLQSLGGSDYRRREVSPGWRAEVETTLAPVARLLVGTDGSVTPYRGKVFLPSEVSPTDEDVTAVDTTIATYGIVHLGRGVWRLSPGARLQAFGARSEFVAVVDPRFDAGFRLSDRVTLDVGIGRYSLPRTASSSAAGGLVDRVVGSAGNRIVLPAALRDSFEPEVVVGTGPPELRLLTADQASTSVTVELPWSLEARLGAFARRWNDPPGQQPPGAFAAEFSPVTSGWDAGGELLVRKHLTRRLHGWVAYTLMRSWEERGGLRHAAPFDQRHNLVALLSYQLPRDVRVGGRFRVTSGSPLTPFVAVVDRPDRLGAETVPLYGAENSANFPLFHQLDLRVDKTWRLNRASIEGYFDVQNVYNRLNTEAYFYSPDYRTRTGSFGLPIFPTLGVTVRW